MSRPASSGLSEADVLRLEEIGIGAEEAERQLRLLRTPPPPVRLVRPCTLGDGILPLERESRAELFARFEEVLGGRTVTKFVPASGAATRMFRDLLAGDDQEVSRLLDELPELPFCAELSRALAERGESLEALAGSREAEPILRVLLDPDGLGYADLPKGLIPFHRYGGLSHCPLEEHLRETARLGGDLDRGGPIGMHVTIAPDARRRFEEALPELLSRVRAACGETLEVELSEQSPATDTLAVDVAGDPVRDADGALLLRPGGHGALLRNLAGLSAELVLIKNIDNVLPGPRQEETVEVERLLFGELLRLEARQYELQRRLAGEGDVAGAEIDEVRELLARELGRPAAAELDAPADALRAALRDELCRPLRVCGVVRNTGEPGGGPFWVRAQSGEVTPQIVESSQVDHAEADQADVFRSATHFNPVLIVGSLRDFRGRAYDLPRFVDESTAFVTTKSAAGEEIRALERPGLWNGSMSGWCTVFVEVPGTTFAPVKTVFDLLREEHRVAEPG